MSCTGVRFHDYHFGGSPIFCHYCIYLVFRVLDGMLSPHHKLPGSPMLGVGGSSLDSADTLLMTPRGADCSSSSSWLLLLLAHVEFLKSSRAILYREQGLYDHHTCSRLVQCCQTAREAEIQEQHSAPSNAVNPCKCFMVKLASLVTLNPIKLAELLCGRLEKKKFQTGEATRTLSRNKHLFATCDLRPMATSPSRAPRPTGRTSVPYGLQQLEV